ncbi:MAG: DUF1800 domain-containing protein [Planctomycetales bacterium]|nr:DUF1800 domain-containing protein [Planctomycetales bacterium]
MTSKRWQRYTPTTDEPWNLSRANHLHRRASFGATWGELQRDVDDGWEASVGRLLTGTSRQYGQREDFESISRIIGESAVAGGDASRLKAWWLFRILFTPDPLQEKLALLWHDHFATSNRKVQNLRLMQQQNELFRSRASAKFGHLLHEIVKDPAMLVWLDAGLNQKSQPNENLSRELMELFTLGVGNYAESDVQEAARALTGWRIRNMKAEYNMERHDQGELAILGVVGAFDSEKLCDLLLGQDATSRRLAGTLCDLFMGEDVADAEAIDELSLGLKRNDLSIQWAVETILCSQLFFSDANIGSRVSSPVEFTATAIRSLEMLDNPPSTLVLAEWCSRLGQDLFYPPNVSGWNGGRAWLTSRTVVGRSNFAAAMVTGQLRVPSTTVEWSPSVEKLGRAEQLQKLLLSNPNRQRSKVEAMKLSEFIAHTLSLPEAFVC